MSWMGDGEVGGEADAEIRRRFASEDSLRGLLAAGEARLSLRDGLTWAYVVNRAEGSELGMMNVL